ncbi:MAG TPA: hypothetical protein VLH18_04875 [Candidatus Limnocylindrales bacterium]|nr:hypothetical protein [Candidatus Limnocylindrales bacterium]
MNNQTKNNEQSRAKKTNKPRQSSQNPASANQNPQSKTEPSKKKTILQQKTGPQPKPTAKQPPVSKKETASTQKIQQQLQSEKANNAGMRFEITVANHFRSMGWNPTIRAEMFGYEYDLYEEQKNAWQPKYLVVECKNSAMVSAKDVVHFLVKVRKLAENIPQALYHKPEVHAFFCYTGDVDEEAVLVAKSHNPSVTMIKFV